ncbi:hypothetical protein P5V15_014363 [Pogonomyrmex californicus]
MSLTLTLNEKSSVLAANYFSVIDLSDVDYELSLTILETYHTIPNVNASNNTFYFGKDDTEITIPEGSYEFQVIYAFLRREILRKRSRRDTLDGNASDTARGDDEIGEYPIVLRANNTMKC